MRDQVEVIPGVPADADCPWDLDLGAYFDRMVREFGDASGVTSTSDYPGAAAAAILARRLGLSGPSPASVLRTSHKYLSRLAQRESVPEAVPRFALVDPRNPIAPPFPAPYFLKPVKGAFSIMTRRIDAPEDLTGFLHRAAVREFLTYYVRLFEDLLTFCPELGQDARAFLAEELLTGDQVTVEGCVAGGEVTILGIVDSILDPDTRSFVRFDYPSRLPEPLLARMASVVQRVIRHLQLDHALFNVEMIHDPKTDRLSIIEINPRLCGQFADLHLHVDGVSTYETMIDLALGGRPSHRPRQGAYGAASSFPLRVFEPVRAESLPGPERIQEIEARFPGSSIWIEAGEGDLLEEFEILEDGHSVRYGVVNVAGADRREVHTRFREIENALGCRLAARDPALRRA
jgi:biotin carboxylase